MIVMMMLIVDLITIMEAMAMYSTGLIFASNSSSFQ